MIIEFFKRKKQRKLQLLREEAIKRINYLTIRYMETYGNDPSHIDDFMKAQYVNSLIRKI